MEVGPMALILVFVEPCDVGPTPVLHRTCQFQRGHPHLKIAPKLEAGRRECVQCSFFGRHHC